MPVDTSFLCTYKHDNNINNNLGLVIGVVVVLFATALVLMAVGFYFLYCQRYRQFNIRQLAIFLWNKKQRIIDKNLHVLLKDLCLILLRRAYEKRLAILFIYKNDIF